METITKPKTDYTPATLDEASKLLLKAADYIEKNGLSCGGLVDPMGRWCVVHTLSMLDFNVSTQSCVKLEKSGGIDGIGSWSDAAGSSGRVHEIVAKLRAVALS